MAVHAVLNPATVSLKNPFGCPPPGIFNKKSSPTPSRRLGLPFPSPEQKKYKKISETSTQLGGEDPLNFQKGAHPGVGAGCLETLVSTIFFEGRPSCKHYRCRRN